MLQPQAVIFDIGNVLIEWHPERFYDSRIGAARRQQFMSEVPIHDANLRIDAGAPFRQTLVDLAAQYPLWATEVMWWHDDWRQMVDPVIPHSVDLLRRLRAKGIPVFALTNFGRETFDYALTQFDFLNEFDRSYVSGKLGVIKPEAAIYAHVEADCGLAPKDLLFADDRAENVVAALRRGWRAHQFESAGGFAARLVAEGLLTNKEAGL